MKWGFTHAIFYLFLPILSGFSQNLENTLSDEVCTCLSGSTYTETDSQQGLLAMGICMLESSQKHQQEINTAWNIDVNNEKGMEALGQKLSLSLMIKCPTFLEIMTLLLKDENSPLLDIIQTKPAFTSGHPIAPLEGAESFTGIVKDFIPLPLAQVEIADSFGDTRFHFVHYFTGQELIANGEDLIGKKVEITFHESEYYNPEKRRFEVINEVNTIRITP